MSHHYRTEREIEAVVEGFENCTTSKEDFSHREHLTVAVWYLRHFDEADALKRMRAGLIRFLNHHKIAPGKYKEGLTVAWMDLITSALAELNPTLCEVEITNAILDCLSDSTSVQNRER